MQIKKMNFNFMKKNNHKKTKKIFRYKDNTIVKNDLKIYENNLIVEIEYLKNEIQKLKNIKKQKILKNKKKGKKISFENIENQIYKLELKIEEIERYKDYYLINTKTKVRYKIFQIQEMNFDIFTKYEVLSKKEQFNDFLMQNKCNFSIIIFPENLDIDEKIDSTITKILLKKYTKDKVKNFINEYKTNYKKLFDYEIIKKLEEIDIEIIKNEITKLSKLNNLKYRKNYLMIEYLNENSRFEKDYFIYTLNEVEIYDQLNILKNFKTIKVGE